jgi:hypothetical protein
VRRHAPLGTEDGVESGLGWPAWQVGPEWVPPPEKALGRVHPRRWGLGRAYPWFETRLGPTLGDGAIRGPTLGKGAEGGPMRGEACVGPVARGTGFSVVVHAGAG